MSPAIQSLILFVAIIAFMYLLVIRPQRRRQLAMMEMQRSLGPGDQVLTAGGLYGTVTEVEDGGTLLIEISEDTEVRIAANAVTHIVKDSDAVPTHDVSSASPSE